LTVSFSLIASLIVAITLVPMLSSKLLSKAMEEGRRYWFDRFLEKLNHAYARALEKVLKFRKTSIFTTILLIIVSIALLPFVGAEFIPAGDQGQLTVSVETAPGTSAKETKKVVDQVNDKMDEYEDIIDVSYVTVGGDGDFTGGASGANEASFTIQLVDPSDRE